MLDCPSSRKAWDFPEPPLLLPPELLLLELLLELLLPPLVTVIPLTFGLSVTEVNWITTWPLLLAVVLNVWAMALFWPPAVA